MRKHTFFVYFFSGIKNKISLFLLLFIGINGWSQSNSQSTSHCIEDDQFKPYKEEATKQLERIKRYFEQVYSSSLLDSNKVQANAAERRIKKAFRSIEGDQYIPYKGVILDENFEFKQIRKTADVYLELIKQFAQKNRGLINMCWNFKPSEEIEYKYVAKELIGRVNGKIPPSATKTIREQPQEFYCIYQGAGYLREEITFFKDNLIHSYSVCKEVSFQLRYLEVDDELYEWRVVIAEIDNSNTQGDCSDIERVECTPLPGVCDSSVMYRDVAAWTYLVPGAGWEHFVKQKDKKLRIWPLITAASLTAFGIGTYNKIISNKWYNDHLSATTLRELSSSYEKANTRHHNFIHFTAAGILIWGVSDGVLIAKNNRYRRIFNERFGCDRPSLTNSTIDDGGNQPYSRLAPVVLISPQSTLGVGLTYSLRF